MRQSCDSFCVHNLRKTTFVCTIATDNFVCTTAIDNILSTTPIVNFCMPYCNCQSFYGTTTFVWTIATNTINITLLQLLTFKCTMVIDNFLCTIAIDYFCMHYCNCQLLYDVLQMMAIARCRTTLRTSVTLIATAHINL